MRSQIGYRRLFGRPGEAGAPGPAPRRVLLAEDDEVIREIIDAVCKRVDPQIEIDATSRGEMAERLLREDGIYDLVILDVGLADRKTGIDVWRRMKDRMPGVPFIFITSMSSDDLALEVGPADKRTYFVSKPFSLGQLADVMITAFAIQAS